MVLSAKRRELVFDSSRRRELVLSTRRRELGFSTRRRRELVPVPGVDGVGLQYQEEGVGLQR